MNPLASIIVATYNRPDTVNETLASCYAQDYGNIEVILYRDGGCHIEPIRDPRMKYISCDQNHGAAYANNRAIEASNGEYICYVGDDDIYYPNHVSALLKAIGNGQVAYSDLYKRYYRMIYGKRYPLAKNVEISRDFNRDMMWHFNHVLGMSLMHHRSTLEKTGMYNETLNVLIDYDMTRRLCFYYDFIHTRTITGEFFAEEDDGGDRISVRGRRSPQNYIRNLSTILHTRPPKPWVIPDLSIECEDDKLYAELHEAIWYPHDRNNPEAEFVLEATGRVNPFAVVHAIGDGGKIIENGVVYKRS